VVGGLVEQRDVGLRHEQPREGEARGLAAGEAATRWRRGRRSRARAAPRRGGRGGRSRRGARRPRAAAPSGRSARGRRARRARAPRARLGGVELGTNAASATASIVSPVGKSGSCSSMPTWTPARTNTLPASGASTRWISRSSVDLPLPLRPMSAVRSPGVSSRWTPSRTVCRRTTCGHPVRPPGPSGKCTPRDARSASGA
jgi:hypothetical protein